MSLLSSAINDLLTTGAEKAERPKHSRCHWEGAAEGVVWKVDAGGILAGLG